MDVFLCCLQLLVAHPLLYYRGVSPPPVQSMGDVGVPESVYGHIALACEFLDRPGDVVRDLAPLLRQKIQAVEIVCPAFLELPQKWL